jgi:DNA-binding MarR family transcriptional regulator
MGIAITSRLAYDSVQELSNKQAEVLEKIEELQPCSSKEIAKALNWEINRVTGRVNELAKKELIKSEKMARNNIGRLEKLWEIKEEYGNK